jgi:hypothetical protein
MDDRSSRRMPDDDSEGEDLMDDNQLRADYRDIQELDQYDPTMLAGDADHGVDHDARRAADVEMARRDAARGLRPQGLDDDDYFDDEQDETYQARQRRLKRMRQAAGAAEDEDDGAVSVSFVVGRFSQCLAISGTCPPFSRVLPPRNMLNSPPKIGVAP